MSQNIEIVKLQIRRGLEKDLPTLDVGEPAITTDTNKMFIGDGTVNHEIAKLADLNNTNNSVNDILQNKLAAKVDAIAMASKADVSYVDNKVAAVASGAPKGVYSTLSALQTAKPTGDNNVYVVTGNVQEVDLLTVTAPPTTSGNVAVTLNGVATNVAVTTGVAEVDALTVSGGPTAVGTSNVTVTLNGVATNVSVNGGTKEVDTLTVSAGATTAGNITVTLNGTAVNVAVAASDTVGAIGDKIRATAFTGWTVGGTAGSATVTFTKTTVGTNTAPTFSGGSTGSTGTFAVTTAGVAADTTAQVATKIAGGTYSGWTASASASVVTFTKTTIGTNTAPTFSAGTTGTTATFAVTTTGLAADTTTTVATKIRGTSFPGWTTGSTGTTVTFTKTTGGTNTAPSYSAGTTGATGTMAVSTLGTAPDGNWYYYSGGWKAGGLYQSATAKANTADVATSAGVYSIASGLTHTDGTSAGGNITYEGNSKVRISYPVGAATSSIYVARMALCTLADLVNKQVYIKTADFNTADPANNTNGYSVGFTAGAGNGQQWGWDTYSVTFTSCLNGFVIDGNAIRTSILASGNLSNSKDSDTVYISLKNSNDYASQVTKSCNKTLQAYVTGISDTVVNATSLGTYTATDITNLKNSLPSANATALTVTAYAGDQSAFRNFTITNSGLTYTVTRPQLDNSALHWSYVIVAVDLGTLASMQNKVFYTHFDQTNSGQKLVYTPRFTKSASDWSTSTDSSQTYDPTSYYNIFDPYAQVKANGSWADTDHVYMMFRSDIPANTASNATILPLQVDYSVIPLTKQQMTDKKTGFMVADGLATPNPYATHADVTAALSGASTSISEIVCWGDSLTAMGGWTDQLATLTGLPVLNGGTGGENVRTITARQGGDVMVVNNITIPADTTTPVTIATYSGINTAFGFKSTPLLQGGSHVNPVMVGDVECTLTWTGSSYSDTSGVWTLKRNQVAASPTVINRPTAIRTNFDKVHNGKNALMVIYMGQNGGYTDDTDLINKHQLMIDHFKGKEYVVIGLSSGSASSRAQYEADMQNAFGRRFISLRQYLAAPIYDGSGNIISCYGCDDTGIVPTSADLTSIGTGTVPSSLLVDTVHYQPVTRTAIGNMLYKKFKELNIL